MLLTSSKCVGSELKLHCRTKIFRQLTSVCLIYVQFPGQSSSNAVRCYWFSTLSFPFYTHRQLPHQLSIIFQHPLSPVRAVMALEILQHSKLVQLERPRKKFHEIKIIFHFIFLSVLMVQARRFLQNVVPIRSEILSDSFQHWWWETSGGGGSVTIAVWSSGYSLFQFSSSAEKLRTHVGRSHSSCYQRTDITSKNATQINNDELCGSVVVYSWVIILR